MNDAIIFAVAVVVGTLSGSAIAAIINYHIARRVFDRRLRRYQ